MKATKKWGRAAVILSLLVSVLSIIGGTTIAYLIAQSEKVENTFDPGVVNCYVEEVFADNQKTSIAVRNTGNVPAYIRIKLVPMWYNSENQLTGKEIWTPEFTLSSAWEYDSTNNCYYCKEPVNPGESTANLIAEESKIILSKAADDTYQGLEIFAQAIQSTPASAVQDAWGWTPSGN